MFINMFLIKFSNGRGEFIFKTTNLYADNTSAQLLTPTILFHNFVLVLSTPYLSIFFFS